MICFAVQAYDEFGRKFNATKVIPSVQDEQAIFNVTNYMMNSLIREILREMGETASADWYGNTWTVNMDSLMEENGTRT